MGARDDAPPRHGRAILQLDAVRASVADVDPFHRCVQPDLGPGGRRGIGHGPADGTHPSVDPAPRALVSFHGAHPVMQQHVGAAGAHRSAPRADDRLRCERALDAIVLEPFIQEVGSAHREQPHDLSRIAARPLTNLPAERQPLGDVHHSEVRGDHVEQVVDQPSEMRQILVELDVRVRIRLGELRDLGVRPLGIAPEGHRGSVGIWDVVIGLEDRDLVSMAPQLQVRDDLFGHEADDVGRRRDAVARPRLLGGRRAARDRALLENDDVQSPAGEVGRASEAVVAAADHDDVVRAIAHRQILSSGPEEWSTYPDAPRPATAQCLNS